MLCYLMLASAPDTLADTYDGFDIAMSSILLWKRGWKRGIGLMAVRARVSKRSHHLLACTTGCEK